MLFCIDVAGQLLQNVLGYDPKMKQAGYEKKALMPVIGWNRSVVATLCYSEKNVEDSRRKSTAIWAGE